MGIQYHQMLSKVSNTVKGLKMEVTGVPTHKRVGRALVCLLLGSRKALGRCGKPRTAKRPQMEGPLVGWAELGTWREGGDSPGPGPLLGFDTLTECCPIGRIPRKFFNLFWISPI